MIIWHESGGKIIDVPFDSEDFALSPEDFSEKYADSLKSQSDSGGAGVKSNAA